MTATHDLENVKPVRAGEDRHQQPGQLIWGQILLETKVSTAETGGAFYSFESRDMPQGGPPRHVHHEQDEWFYIVKGEFIFEVGNERHALKPGDSLFAPRGIPHTFACIGGNGTLLITVSPAGTFEAFILETTRTTDLPSPGEMARHLEQHDMTLLGPPLEVE